MGWHGVEKEEMWIGWGGGHRNIRPRMRAPILFQVNK